MLTDLWLSGLDLQASMALNRAITERDRQYPLADGKRFPRIPRLRASVFADYRFAPQWDASLGIRHSGRQYGTPDNSDFVDSYGAVSAFTVADAKLRWSFVPGWTAAVGATDSIDQRAAIGHRLQAAGVGHYPTRPYAAATLEQLDYLIDPNWGGEPPACWCCAPMAPARVTAAR